jgi:hypothetical protein
MIKSYKNDTVLLKLIYFSNKKKEVYFKRSDVTEYIINESPFEIPNKQGFDGNLTYFGYDIKNDTDGNRILLLRGSKLNEACLNGSLTFKFMADYVDIESSDSGVFNEIDYLITNKTVEARAFDVFKQVNKKHHLIESQHRLFGNKKLYINKKKEYYTYPRVLFNNSTKKVIYELVNTANFLKFLPQIVFPIFNSRFRYQTEKILTYKDLADRNLFSETDTDFIYLQMNGNRLEEIDIQEESAINIINKINLNEYSLDGKETTKKALTNVRLNTQNLRSFALARDNSKCLLCDINTDDFLICSHIKPWQTGQARLDLNNVLTLCRFHDALFDKGYISIDNNGDIINSNQDIVNKDTTRSLLSVSNSRVKRIINSRMKKYLEYHRANVYKG